MHSLPPDVQTYPAVKLPFSILHFSALQLDFCGKALEKHLQEHLEQHRKIEVV